MTERIDLTKEQGLLEAIATEATRGTVDLNAQVCGATGQFSSLDHSEKRVFLCRGIIRGALIELTAGMFDADKHVEKAFFLAMDYLADEIRRQQNAVKSN